MHESPVSFGIVLEFASVLVVPYFVSFTSDAVVGLLAGL